ncbi:hypothetical protein VTH82DRAFT_1616 [Thermothelomyces myriococcoides]
MSRFGGAKGGKSTGDETSKHIGTHHVRSTMELAGFVINIASLWQTAVSVWDLIDSTRQFGEDSEFINSMLELQRIRLQEWGRAVGLQSLRVSDNTNLPFERSRSERTHASSQIWHHKLHPRLHDKRTILIVFGLLKHIERIFDNTGLLQERYGLQPADGSGAAAVLEPEETDIPPLETRPTPSCVIKRLSAIMVKSARKRQRETPLARKMRWAVRDRKKFRSLVDELQCLNNNLESLFFGPQALAVMAMRSEIKAAEAVHRPSFQQEEKVGVNEALSEYAGMVCSRPEMTELARSEPLSTSKAWSDADSEDTVGDAANTPEEEGEVQQHVGEVDWETETIGAEVAELEKRRRDLGLYVGKKNFGALTTSVIRPISSLAPVSAYVYWDGQTADRDWPPSRMERANGSVAASHAAFEMYKKKRYMKFRPSECDSLDPEDYVLLDPECHAELENVNAGTVTVEGFGIERWALEEKTTQKNHVVMANRSKLPALHPSKILRRLHEIQKNPDNFGCHPIDEELSLLEFFGTPGIVCDDQEFTRDPECWISNLCSILNRPDIFANFLTESSISMQCASFGDKHSIGIWDFLRQIILSWELATRLKHLDGSRCHPGFTDRILANVIVSDLWLKHVKVTLADQRIRAGDLKPPKTAEEKARAERFNEKGNDAMKRREYQEAVNLYTKAIKIDLGNAVYRCNRSAAFLEIHEFRAAERDAYFATQLDPKYAKAWSCMGKAILEQGYDELAKKAYEQAFRVAGERPCQAMRKGLADSKTRAQEIMNAFKTEHDVERAYNLRSAFLDKDWETIGKIPELHSLVHEQQVEGLLLFGERMKWPFINEVRDYAEEVYNIIRGGSTVNSHLYDWLYGLTLPGKWFAHKIMTALILCTPSIRDKVGIAHYYECGLSLRTRSYWRVRTVLGRVLGCLPGVVSLCGWIGPCPPVKFEPPLSAKPRHIRIHARSVSGRKYRTDQKEEVGAINLGGPLDRWPATLIQLDEEIDHYLADLKNSSKWIVPEPPVRDTSTCSIVSIKLTKLPLRMDNISRRPDFRSSDDETKRLIIENETEYRARIVFSRDDNTSLITYTLFTNPVFVTLPACRPEPRGQAHEVHMRELKHYQNIWSIERLKEHIIAGEADLNEDDDDEEAAAASVVVINATGKGAEVLARAWCSEKGRDAVIRRAGGPCFACAVRAAGKGGLGTGVLIWTE